MRFRNILLTLIGIFLLIGLFIYIEPSITGLVVQERFLISNVSVSADKFDQKVRVEQFDDYEIKFDNALYYFIADVEKEQKINYVLLEFIVDSSQIVDFDKDDIELYLYKDGWIKLDTEFVKEFGRFYYYKAKSEEFGLFAVAPKKEVSILPKINKNDLVLFGLVPILGIILLFSFFSYTSVRLVQRINYRLYLLFKKLLIGLIKFGLSFGIVVLVLDLVSPKAGITSEINIIYYAVIPLIILTLFFGIILNLVLKLHKIISTKVYKIFRNLFWSFIFVLTIIFGLLIRFVPEIEGSLGENELIIYGILPLVFIASFVVFVLVKKIFLVERYE